MDRNHDTLGASDTENRLNEDRQKVFRGRKVSELSNDAGLQRRKLAFAKEFRERSRGTLSSKSRPLEGLHLLVSSLVLLLSGDE